MATTVVFSGGPSPGEGVAEVLAAALGPGSAPPDRVIAEAEYGEPFPAAVRSGRRVAVQFHPEKSGAAGLRILANFCGPEVPA